jgi:CxxC-x17-CxxC domain-containing protein
MVRYEYSEGKSKGKGPKSRFSKKPSRGNGGYDDRPKRRESNRPYSRDKPKLEMTKVTCSSCGVECEVPFKPTSSKPVYCSDCFTKNGKGSSNKDFEMINEKLNKIMKALDIE